MNLIAIIDNKVNSGAGHIKRSLLLLKSFSKFYTLEKTIIYLNNTDDIFLWNLLKDSKFNLSQTSLRIFDENLNNFEIKNKNDFLIIDSYVITNYFIKKIKAKYKTLKVLRILDRPEFSNADYIVDYNPLAISSWGNYKFNLNSKYLLGLDYFISDFSAYPKEFHNNVDSDLLITFGYSNQNELISNCLKGLVKFKELNLKKIIIIGNYSDKFIREIKDKSSNSNIIFLKPVKNLLPFIANTKLFLTSSSTQMYESSYYQIPTICLELNKSQINSSECYDKLGLWFYVPNNELNTVEDYLGELVTNIFSKYKYILSQCWGSKAINKKGQNKIVIDIKNQTFDSNNLLKDYKNKKDEEITIETIENNMKFINVYLDLRNLKNNRKVMVDDKLIPRLHHYNWWLQNYSRNSKIFKRSNDQKIIIWEKPITLQSNNYLIGGWFGTNYKRASLDAYSLVKEQIKFCKIHYPEHIWLVLIHKENKFVLNMNLSLGFKHVELVDNEKLISDFREAFNIDNLESFNTLILDNKL